MRMKRWHIDYRGALRGALRKICARVVMREARYVAFSRMRVQHALFFLSSPLCRCCLIRHSEGHACAHTELRHVHSDVDGCYVLSIYLLMTPYQSGYAAMIYDEHIEDDGAYVDITYR